MSLEPNPTTVCPLTKFVLSPSTRILTSVPATTTAGLTAAMVAGFEYGYTYCGGVPNGIACPDVCPSGFIASTDAL